MDGLFDAGLVPAAQGPQEKQTALQWTRLSPATPNPTPSATRCA